MADAASRLRMYLRMLPRPGVDLPGPGTAALTLVGGVGLMVALFAVLRPEPPEPVPLRQATLPVLPVIRPEFDGAPLAERLRRSSLADEQLDELLTSPLLYDVEFSRATHAWVRYWRVSARTWFPGFLERMAWLGATVDSAVGANGYPPSLRYLPLIESGYSPSVTSRASAVGLWQLMPGTARDLGLEVGPLVDERRHPLRSTDAALRYLGQLREEFGSWPLALAAYNSGPARIRQIMKRHAPGEPGSDLLYWRLRDHMPRETAEFVPKLYGAMWVASRPEAYGYPSPEVDPFAFDAVSVPDLTSLDVVALASGAPYDEIVRLNPEYIGGVTPPGRAVSLRVPPGRGARFAEIYPRLTPEQRVTAIRHVVKSGETLVGIAARYGVETERINAVNPSLDRAGLLAGQQLVVPVSPGVAGLAPQ